jgi:hypothetical protein
MGRAEDAMNIVPPEGYTVEQWDRMVAASKVLDFGYSPPPKRLFDTPIPDVPERIWQPFMPRDRPKRIANRTYVVRCGSLVKIGMASDVERRFRDLTAMNALPLEMVVVLPGGREVERPLHLRFARYRDHDEWFRVEGELASWIAEGCPL